MPHPPSQKAQSRARILRSARHLFNRRGFAAVTIDQIMADAGLTRGGFYKHFKTKEQLYAEAIADFNCEGSETWQREAWQRAHVNASACGPQLAKMIVNAYLSQDHFDNQDGSCPKLALGFQLASYRHRVPGNRAFKIRKLLRNEFRKPGEADRFRW